MMNKYAKILTLIGVILCIAIFPWIIGASLSLAWVIIMMAPVLVLAALIVKLIFKILGIK